MPRNQAITGLFPPVQHSAFPPLSALLAAAKAGPLPIIVDEYENGGSGRNYSVVDDGALAGGTKLRIFLPLMQASPAKSFAYASPAYGYAQIALAQAAAMTDKEAHIFVAQRSVLHERTMAAKKLGAHIHQVPHGYLSVVQARVRDYCAGNDCMPIPFGGHFPGAVELIAMAARRIRPTPKEVWCVAASGTLSGGLQLAWLQAKHCVVKVGAERDVRGIGTRSLQEFRAPEKFNQDAKLPPPFASCSNYDAKVWRFFKEHASPGALYWNVGA